MAPSLAAKEIIKFSAFISLFLLGCTQPALDIETWQLRGKQALAPYKVRLRAALVEGMAAGPEAAVQSCRLQAPAIASAVDSPGVEVGRTSHKLRNPANAPRKWMDGLLDEYRAVPDHQAPQVARIDSARIGYVEPIYLKPMCLVCHGDELTESVRSRLLELYPNDQATGFKVGDFRGLFWVEFSAVE